MNLDYLGACTWPYHNAALVVGNFSLSKSSTAEGTVCMSVLPLWNAAFYISLLCDTGFKMQTAQET